MLFETSHWSFPGLILLLSSKGQGQPAWCLFIWWSVIVVVTWVGRMYLPTSTDRGSTKPEFILSSPLASWIWYIHRNDDVFVDGFEAFNAYGTFMPFLQKDVTPLNRSIVIRTRLNLPELHFAIGMKESNSCFPHDAESFPTLAWWRNTWTLTSSSWSLQPWSLDILQIISAIRVWVTCHMPRSVCYWPWPAASPWQWSVHDKREPPPARIMFGAYISLWGWETGALSLASLTL